MFTFVRLKMRLRSIHQNILLCYVVLSKNKIEGECVWCKRERVWLTRESVFGVRESVCVAYEREREVVVED